MADRECAFLLCDLYESLAHRRSRHSSTEEVISLINSVSFDSRVDVEISRATAEEERIESKLDQEIQDRIDDVDAEENRAKAAEQVLTTNLANEITRATQTEQGLNHRIDVLNDELDAEESTRESNDAALSLRITTESNDRIAAINAEKTRAEEAETALRQ